MEMVLGWGAVAIFVGPVVAAFALIGLRWLMNNGTIWHWVGLAVLGFAAWRHFHG